MKNILLFLFTPLCLHAQLFPFDKDGEILYQEVVTVDSVNAKQLFTNSKIFVANSFKNYKQVVQLEDSENFKIVVKGDMQISLLGVGGSKTDFGLVHFKFIIDCKDNKYRYSISELVHEYYRTSYNLSGGNLKNDKPIGPISEEAFLEIKIVTNRQLKEFIEALKKTMITNDTW